jgi:transposase
VVVEVTPSLTVRERRRLRQRGKADPTDVLAIARVVAREQDLPPVRRQDLTEDLRLLVDYREQLLGERTRIANRVHADLVALRPGYQRQLPELRSQRAAGLVRRLLRGQVSVRAELVRRRLDQLDRLDAEIRALKARIGDLVQATGTSLVQVHGVGPWSPRGSLARWATYAALGTGTSSPPPTAPPRSRPLLAAPNGIG